MSQARGHYRQQKRDIGHVPIIADDYRARLHTYMGGIIRSGGAQVLSIGGMPDHVHLAETFSSAELEVKSFEIGHLRTILTIC